MKKVIFSALLVVLCISLFAQITPKGSARVGYWLDSKSEEQSIGDDADLTSRYYLQTNSRFGVDFKQEDFDAKVEFGAGANISLRLLWAKQKFGNWSLLVGQDDFVANQKTTQVWATGEGGDNNLNGYGAIDGGRRVQIRVDMDNGLYFGLVKPNMVNPSGAPADPEFLIPMLNLGYNWKINDKFTLAPTGVFQMFGYNKDNHGIDGDVMSFLVAATADIKATDELLVRASFNIGQNTGNMGFSGPRPTATWNVEDEETNDIMTFGGWLTARYEASSNLFFTLGGGYAVSSNEDWDEDDARMGVYGQAEIRLQKFRLIPEIGLMDDMKDANGNKQGSLMYFGTQLRLDF